VKLTRGLGDKWHEYCFEFWNLGLVDWGGG